jgi:hypothetical protein
MTLYCVQVNIADGADTPEACVMRCALDNAYLPYTTYTVLATEAAAAEREATNAILSGNPPPAPVKPTGAVKHALGDR